MQGVDTQSTLRELLYAYKGSSFCAKERGDFVLCRATPAGRLGDPELCEGKVANFLQCYHDMIKESQESCTAQYERAFACLSANIDKTEHVDGVCSGDLEDFARCRKQ